MTAKENSGWTGEGWQNLLLQKNLLGDPAGVHMPHPFLTLRSSTGNPDARLRAHDWPSTDLLLDLWSERTRYLGPGPTSLNSGGLQKDVEVLSPEFGRQPNKHPERSVPVELLPMYR